MQREQASESAAVKIRRETVMLMNTQHHSKRLISALIVISMFCAIVCVPFAAGASTGTSTSTGTGASTGASTGSSSARASKYPEAHGVVDLSLALINSRIPLDNDDYKVSQKRADIYQRKLADAMHDKYLAENRDPPQPVYAAQRVAYEKQRYTDWRNAELDYERYQNDLKNKLDSLKSDFKRQYTNILDMQKGLKTLQDEMVKLDANIELLNAQINVGIAKPSDMDAYTAQKTKLEADTAAKKRDIALAEYNLKADLKIDQSKQIHLADNDEKFLRYNDANIEKTIKTSVNGCFAVTSNEKKIQILKDERAIMLQWDREGAMITNLQNNEISVKETEYALVNARNSQESSLWSDYYSLLNQEDQISIEELNVKLAQNDYDIAEAKFAQGLVKPIDVQNTHIALENAKTTHQTAINNYMRMRDDFEKRLAN